MDGANPPQIMISRHVPALVEVYDDIQVCELNINCHTEGGFLLDGRGSCSYVVLLILTFRLENETISQYF